MKTATTSFAKWALVLGVVPAVFFYVAMGLIPSFSTFLLSFTDISGVKNVPWKFIGLANYKEFLFQQNTRDLVQVLSNTMVFCIAVTVLQNLVALPVALAVNSKSIRGTAFYRSIVFLPVVLGVLVTSLVWMAVFNPMDGPAQRLLELFGTKSGFFTDKSVALACVIFAQIWWAMGYSMVINLAGLQAIPRDIYEAGAIDGASGWQTFRHITLPMLWSTINANLLLAVIGSLQSFQIILIATGGNNIATQTLAARVVYFAFNINAGSGASAMRQGYGATWAMVLFIFISAVTAIYQRVSKRKGEAS